MDSTPDNILIMKYSSLGDIVHALPAVSALRRRFPHARMTWLVKKTWAPILEGNPDLDEILPVDLGWQNWPGLIKALRKKRYDLIVDFQGLFRSGLIGFCTGARYRVGFARAREGATWFYNHSVPLHESRPRPWRLLDIHAVDRNLAISQFLGADSSQPVFQLPQFPADRRAVELMLRSDESSSRNCLIGLAPWTRSAIKSWPVERFVDAATELLRWPDVRVVLLGGPNDRTAAGQFDHLAPRGLVNTVGKVSLRQVPELMRHLQLLIGNDSAPIHLAAGVGTPVLALYGPTHPQATGPYPLERHRVLRADVSCSPCGQRRCRNHNYLECLHAVSIDRLLREVEIFVRKSTLPKIGPVSLTSSGER